MHGHYIFILLSAGIHLSLYHYIIMWMRLMWYSRISSIHSMQSLVNGHFLVYMLVLFLFINKEPVYNLNVFYQEKLS